MGKVRGSRTLDVGYIIREIRRMVYGKDPSNATALEEVSERWKRDPFRVLVATILSHRTRDENTSRAVERLFSVYKDVREVAEGDEEKIQKLIKPAGFYRVKAKRLKEVARILLERHGGKVPDDFDELISLPSVGRKTANCVLVYGFGELAIPVDTHVHRISNRLGLVETKTPEETEMALMKKVDKKYWREINDLLVRFGQKVCKPVKPLCYICGLRRVCKWY